MRLEVVDYGSCECCSPTTGTGGCCGHTPPDHWLSTITGIVSTGCANCGNYDASWTFHRATPSPTASDIVCLWETPTITACPSGTFPAWFVACLVDGSWYAAPGGNFPTGLGTFPPQYRAASWDGVSPLILTLDTPVDTSLCTNWPPTITLTPVF